jgi:hypothetical protein
MKEPPPPRSEEEDVAIALTKGQSAARLHRDPDFNAAYQELLDQNLNTIVSSKPGQAELREDAYYRIRGIQEMAYKLNEWRVIAEQLEAGIQQANSPEGQE